MDSDRKRSLEEKLREMFESSLKFQEKNPATPYQSNLCTVIRRRKGEEDKRICVMRQD